MLKPIKLFGVEQRVQNCFFIHIDGEGYWFLSTGKRLAGEAIQLKEVIQSIQRKDLENSWLVLEIIKNHEQLLKEEFLELNPNNLTSEELSVLQNDKDALDEKLELYVKYLISNEKVWHPAISPYQSTLTNILVNTNVFEYQIQIVKAAFKFRLITDTDKLTVSTEDPEKATFNNIDNAGNSFVGYIGDIDVSDLSEELIVKIYQFCQSEYSKIPWKTTRDIELASKASNEEEEFIESADTDTEKKSELLKPLKELRTKDN